MTATIGGRLAATKLFLEANGTTLDIDVEPKVLTGIRDGFYQTNEVVEWLKGMESEPSYVPEREFRRLPSEIIEKDRDVLEAIGNL